MFIPKIDDEVSLLLGIDENNSSPERRLLAALLERAILDYVGNDRSEVEAAQSWLFDWQKNETLEKERLNEFTFPWVCHYLDLNPDKVAAYIKAMPKRGNNRIAPWYFNKNEEPRAYACIR